MVIEDLTLSIRQKISTLILMLNSNNLQNFKSLNFEINREMIQLKIEILAKKDKNLINIISLPDYQNYLDYYTREIEPITPINLEEGNGIYLSLFKEELIPKLELILVIINRILEFVLPTKNIVVIKSNKYLNKLQSKTYIAKKELLERTEFKIINFFASGGRAGFSELAKVDSSRKTDNLHARIPRPLDNHRIIYSWVPSKKTIIFEDIGTHTEVGFGKC